MSFEILSETLDSEGRYHSFDDKPAIAYKDGSMRWLHHGIPHRENNQPAAIWELGDGQVKQWVVNDQMHRTDGPAYIKEYVGETADYTWWVRDTRTHNAKDFQRISGNTDEQMAEIILKYGPVT